MPFAKLGVALFNFQDRKLQFVEFGLLFDTHTHAVNKFPNAMAHNPPGTGEMQYEIEHNHM